MFSLSFLALMVAAVSAAPSLHARHEIKNVPSFNITAYEKFTPYAVGQPITLGLESSTSDANYFRLATLASYPHDDWDFQLVEGDLLGSPKSKMGVGATAGPTFAGQGPQFTQHLGSTAAPFYSIIDSKLSVLGDTEGWFLCPASTDPSALIEAVYKPDSDTTVFASCKAVDLHTS